jgi:hypothetical protein
MSNLLKKNNLGNIFAELDSETNVSLPKYLNIKNINSSDNVSNFLPQKGGSFTSKGPEKNTDDQVNQLISMLTSESEDKHNFSANSTATEVLENRLRNMLQDGGAKNKKGKKQRGGAGESDAELREAYNKLRNAGYNVKLNDKPAGEYFGENSEASALSALFVSPKQVSASSMSKQNLPANNTALLNSQRSIVERSKLPSASRLSLDSATSTDLPANIDTAALDSQTSSVRLPSARLPSARLSLDSATSTDLPANIDTAALDSQTSSVRLPSARLPSVRLPSARLSLDSATSTDLPANLNLDALAASETSQSEQIRSPSFRLPSSRLPSVRLPSTRLPSARLPSARLSLDSATSTDLPSTMNLNGLAASETSQSEELRLPSARLPSARLPSARLPVDSATSTNNVPCNQFVGSETSTALASAINANAQYLSSGERSSALLESLRKSASAPKSSENIFTQYSAKPSSPSKREPNLIESAISGTVGVVNELASDVMKVGEGALDLVDTVIGGVVNTVTGSVKVVANTFNRVLDDDKPKSVQAGGAKKSSRKGSKKSSRKGSRKGSKKSSRKGSKKSSRKGSKKSSKKASRKGSKKLSGGANDGFEAFLKLKKSVAELLEISNGPVAAKAAGAAQKEIKAKNPDLDSVKVSEEALKLVKANPSKYKEIAEQK